MALARVQWVEEACLERCQEIGANVWVRISKRAGGTGVWRNVCGSRGGRSNEVASWRSPVPSRQLWVIRG